MYVTAAQLIGGYVGPEWLVEPVGEPSDQEDIDAINAANTHVMDHTVMGWGDYNAIIRVADTITSALGAYYLAKITEKENMNAGMARKYRGYNETVAGGPVTDEEIAAARTCGYINAYRLGVYDVLASRQADLPAGWRVATTDCTHEYALPAPVFANALTEPILMGFVCVHSGDPHWPIWLYKEMARA